MVKDALSGEVQLVSKIVAVIDGKAAEAAGHHLTPISIEYVTRTGIGFLELTEGAAVSLVVALSHHLKARGVALDP